MSDSYNKDFGKYFFLSLSLEKFSLCAVVDSFSLQSSAHA